MDSCSAAECLRGVATCPQGDQKQGRYKMTLTDLMNHHYANAVREGMIDLTLGRANKEVKIGDIVEMLLSISFACTRRYARVGVARNIYG